MVYMLIKIKIAIIIAEYLPFTETGYGISEILLQSKQIWLMILLGVVVNLLPVVFVRKWTMLVKYP
jgi:hypothetical protein